MRSLPLLFIGRSLLPQRLSGCKDVLERLPTQPASRLEELLPQRWQPLQTTH
jgi:hypothetical protein